MRHQLAAARNEAQPAENNTQPVADLADNVHTTAALANEAVRRNVQEAWLQAAHPGRDEVRQQLAAARNETQLAENNAQPVADLADIVHKINLALVAHIVLDPKRLGTSMACYPHS